MVLSCTSEKEFYDNVYFEPKKDKFCGTYYIENRFYEKNKLKKSDTIKLILKKNMTFEVVNYPIKKYLDEKIDKFINAKGTWEYTELKSIKNTPKNELTSSIGISLNFNDKILDDDKKNVLKDFENIKTNLRDSTKYLLMTYY